MTVDVHAFVGPYAWRYLDDPSPVALLRSMDRLGIDTAWVASLPAVFHRDPRPANADLVRLLRPHVGRLRPVPIVHPGLPDIERDLELAAEAGAPAVRTYPTCQGLDPASDAMTSLALAAAHRGLRLHVTVRLEDARQRHPLDGAPDFPAAAVRALARLEGARLVVSGATRSYVEEVHYGLTAAERERVLWDIAWIWGPPEDDLRHLVSTVGARRFVVGTGWPLRIPDTPLVQLDLLPLTAEDRDRILRTNVESGS